MFRDKGLTDEFKSSMESQYDVELIGNRARVYSNNPFAKKPSRFRKLKVIGKNRFQLKVNGLEVFFRTTRIKNL